MLYLVSSYETVSDKISANFIYYLVRFRFQSIKKKICKKIRKLFTHVFFNAFMEKKTRLNVNFW